MTREEAIKVAYGISVTKAQHEALQFLIPELRESEDERIRREIIDFICWEIDRGSVTKEQREKSNSWLAYLERQKEQKPAEWSEEDEQWLDNAIYFLESAKSHYADPYEIEATIIWLKSLKNRGNSPKGSANSPSWKPSKDEERLIKTSISFLKDFADKGYENAVECIDWLKSKLNGNTCE